jgi:hypothetical protein
MVVEVGFRYAYLHMYLGLRCCRHEREIAGLYSPLKTPRKFFDEIEVAPRFFKNGIPFVASRSFEPNGNKSGHGT